MATQKRSLTSILRELHQQLDPAAPRHLPLAERRTAVAPLLETLGSVGEAIADAVDAATGDEGGNGGGSSDDRRSSEGGTARRAGTRTGDGAGKPQSQASQQQRREARGVRVVTSDEPAKPAPAKPVVKQPVTKPAKSGESNAVKLWRLLIG